ncbi:MAG: CarD family transcriptional regulator, partial [Pseudomonadota bacterium]
MPQQTLLTLPEKSVSHWGRLYGSADALAIATLASSRDQLVLVITPSMADAYHLEDALRFFCPPTLPIYSFPDWETLPYDLFSPHQELVSQRLKTLYQLPSLNKGILVLPVSTLLQRLCPPSYIQQQSLVFRVDQELPIDTLRGQLTKVGYRNVSEVHEHGEFAVRGSLLDLFPMASDMPYRIDYFDDTIDAIFRFDPDDQIARQEDKIDKVNMLPAREFPMDEAAITRFRQRFREQFDSSRSSPIYRDVSNGVVPSGIEYYMPLFLPEMATVFDYLCKDSIVVQVGSCQNAMDEFTEQTAERYEQRRYDIERPVLPPEQLFIDSKEVTERLKRRERIHLSHAELPDGKGKYNFATRAPGKYPITVRLDQPLGLLKEFLDQFDGRVLFCAESAGRREAFMEMLIANQVSVASVDSFNEFIENDRDLCICEAPLDNGLIATDAGIAIICESQLTGNQISRNRRNRRVTPDSDAVIANLADLSIGAPVVHIDHGVGRYQGLVTLDIGGTDTEYLLIIYANDDKLYVPVASLHLISRYTGASEETAPLHRLGGEQWQKVKRKAAQKAHDVAAELLEIHAKRAARVGFAYSQDNSNYPLFAETFAFEETPDQARAIGEVLA